MATRRLKTRTLIVLYVAAFYGFLFPDYFFVLLPTLCTCVARMMSFFLDSFFMNLIHYRRLCTVSDWYAVVRFLYVLLN